MDWHRRNPLHSFHYGDVLMSAKASQVIGVSIICSTVNLGADHRKHQSSASLAFVSGIGRWLVNSPHKGPGPCITNVFATRRKNISQWHRSFQRKLRSHWLKFLRHVVITLVIQGPVTRKMFPFPDFTMLSCRHCISNDNHNIVICFKFWSNECDSLAFILTGTVYKNTNISHGINHEL